MSPSGDEWWCEFYRGGALVVTISLSSLFPLSMCVCVCVCVCVTSGGASFIEVGSRIVTIRLS